MDSKVIWHLLKYSLGLKKDRYFYNIFLFVIFTLNLIAINKNLISTNIYDLIFYTIPMVSIFLLFSSEFISGSNKFIGKSGNGNSFLYYFSSIKNLDNYTIALLLESIIDAIIFSLVILFTKGNTATIFLIKFSISLIVIIYIRLISFNSHVIKFKKRHFVPLKNKNYSIFDILNSAIIITAFLLFAYFYMYLEKNLALFNLKINFSLIDNDRALTLGVLFFVFVFCFSVREILKKDETPIPPNLSHLNFKYTLPALAIVFILADPTYNIYRQDLKILEHVRLGEIESIDKMITKKPKLLFMSTKNSKSLLHYAARLNNITSTKYLISKGLNINEVVTDNKINYLFYAADNCNLEMTDYLVANGINVNHLNVNNENVLFYAIRVRCLSIIQYLYQNTAINRNQLNKEGLNYVQSGLKNNDSLKKDYPFLKKLNLIKD